MSQILISWIGNADLSASENEKGPNLRLLTSHEHGTFERVYLFNDIPSSGDEWIAYRARVRGDNVRKPNEDEFVAWLAESTSYPTDKFEILQAEKPLKNNLSLLFHFTKARLAELKSRHPDSNFMFLLSAGYPEARVALMVAVEMLFDSKEQKKKRQFVNTSREGDVEIVDMPFDLSLSEEVHLATDEIESATSLDEIVCNTQSMKHMVQQLRKIAPTQFNVFLRGERGTGKTRLAELIHRASSVHKKDNFVARNCAAIPLSLAESLIFGSRTGAATGVGDNIGMVEKADGGTLFLDEIGHTDLHIQAKLLDFIDDGKYWPLGAKKEQKADIRIIVATNLDIETAIKEGRFLPDLYDRLDGFVIEVPPLRCRKPDFEEIARNLFKEIKKSVRVDSISGKTNAGRTLSDEAIELLRRFEWYGNVRELKKKLIQLMVLTDGKTITPDDVTGLLGTNESVGLPLSELNARSFFNLFLAVTEELIDRFARDDNSLPIEKKEKYQLLNDIINPAVIGRSWHLGGNPKGDSSCQIKSGPISFERGIGKSMKTYKQFMDAQLINEELIKEIRGLSSPSTED